MSVILTEKQFRTISGKRHKLSQCEWFRKMYGQTLIINERYHLKFNSNKEETFFRLKYAEYI